MHEQHHRAVLLDFSPPRPMRKIGNSASVDAVKGADAAAPAAGEEQAVLLELAQFGQVTGWGRQQDKEVEVQTTLSSIGTRYS